ncbi:hypothetical protein AK812_SmicGene13946 [Symbiodinium microadriaticum]|uniref:C3H1-type domain-containing protein n=1 Tax=Symbiodinium microadriaticum TaxID=2951 RepID=A0A1Q9E6R6_SYMMI|nr:hypothetical protein AK812_SmicGene13946 [Symbiodinium microadriaticum]
MAMDMMAPVGHPYLGSGLHRCRDNMQISIPEDADAEIYPPEAVQVRNTFIHVATPENGVEDASKHVFSCPASHIGWIEKLFEDDDADEFPPIIPSSRPVICLEDALFEAPSLPYEAAPAPQVSYSYQDPSPFSSEELPSLGSRGHFTKDCRPCAFLHAKGCVNGQMCSFCHLCDKGEKKRRQKAKKAMFQGLHGGA